MSAIALEEAVGAILRERRLTLAVAESCTGGRVASLITAVPGSSEYFLGGVVAYSDELKKKLLAVPPFVLKKAGAVSKDTALAMAVGLARSLGADYSLSVTGLAGPGGGSTEKPVGLVYFALAAPDGVKPMEARFGAGERAQIQASAAQAALRLLLAALRGEPVPEAGEQDA